MWMTAALPYLQAAGTALSFLGSMRQAQAYDQQAKYAEQMGEYNAALAERDAKQTEATAQRAALHEREKAKLYASRWRAAAASSGAGAGVGGDTIGEGIAVAGEENVLNELWRGSQEAQNIRIQGATARWNARNEAQALRENASTQRTASWIGLAKGAASLGEKYAPRPPKKTTSEFEPFRPYDPSWHFDP